MNNKKTDAPILPILQKRWSPRAFADTHISDEIIDELLLAASWSASSFNEQPWRYIVAKKGSTAHAKISETLVEFNQLWAPHAPLLIATFAKKYFGDDPDNTYAHAWHDVGAASAQLTMQALSHDVYVHQMSGFDADALEKSFSIDPAYEPVTVLALGYIGKVDNLPEGGIREAEMKQRERKNISEITLLRE